MRFELTDQTICPPKLDHEHAGGFVQFEGKVRNHAGGREVLLLEYEAYPEMALAEGERLVSEAVERFGLTAAHVIHRVGRLEIGEVAVSIQVAAPHRREAFAGCEWIIDQLKVRVPIWKRETYADGDSGWVGADIVPANASVDRDYFKRQLAVPEIGAAGQAKLAGASVLLVGLGGLGSGSLPVLVGAGIGRLGLVDADHVDLSNLHRQYLYGFDDQARGKADRAAAFARKLRPSIQVDTFPEMLDDRNVDALVQAYDWIIDGTDSLEVKFMLNAAAKRHRKHLVTASIHRFEGHLLTVAPDGPCLECLFPEPPPSGCVDTCAESGVMPGLPALFGVLQANLVLRGILDVGELLRDKMWLFDLKTMDATILNRTSRVDCPGCSGQSKVSIIEFDSIEAARRRFPEIRIIDIREADSIPLPEPAERLEAENLLDRPPAEPALLICQRGITSLDLAHALRRAGCGQAFSLRGGAERWTMQAR